MESYCIYTSPQSEKNSSVNETDKILILTHLSVLLIGFKIKPDYINEEPGCVFMSLTGGRVLLSLVFRDVCGDTLLSGLHVFPPMIQLL